MKNIYKDEIIGSINTNLVYNNEIKGVFGEVVDVSEVPRDNPEIPNILTNQNIIQPYGYTYHFGEFTYLPIPLVNGTSQSAIASYSIDLSEFNAVYNYNEPIKNIEISARLVAKSYSYNNQNVQTSTQTTDIRNFIDRNRDNFTKKINMGEAIDKPNMNYTNGITYLDLITDESIINKFSVMVKVKLPELMAPLILGESSTFLSAGAFVNGQTVYILEPQSIEIIIRGDTYRVTSQSFQYGEQTNALQLKQSTLLTTKSTYKGKRLWEHIGERIVDKHRDGYQVVNLPIIISNEEDMKSINDELYIFDCRRGEIDESNISQVNNASIFKDINGNAKKFVVVNITNNYNGSSNQMLEMQEVT